MQEARNNSRNITATYLVRSCYILAFVLTCFRLTKGRNAYFRPKTIVANFLHLIVLLFKMLFNHIRLSFTFSSPNGIQHGTGTLQCRVRKTK